MAKVTTIFYQTEKEWVILSIHGSMVTCGINATLKEHGVAQPRFCSRRWLLCGTNTRRILYLIQAWNVRKNTRTLGALSSSLRAYIPGPCWIPGSWDLPMLYHPIVVTLSSLKPFFFNGLKKELCFSNNAWSIRPRNPIRATYLINRYSAGGGVHFNSLEAIYWSLPLIKKRRWDADKGPMSPTGTKHQWEIRVSA